MLRRDPVDPPCTRRAQPHLACARVAGQRGVRQQAFRRAMGLFRLADRRP
jgi:hypothetical protein